MVNSLQLKLVCSVLKVACSQLERLIKYQNECETATNFADSHTIPVLNLTFSSVKISNSTDFNNADNNKVNTISQILKNKNNSEKIKDLRGICTQVLSKYRGAVLHLLSCNAVRETSRFKSGLSLLNSLISSSLGMGCGLWVCNVLQLITQVRESNRE